MQLRSGQRASAPPRRRTATLAAATPVLVTTVNQEQGGVLCDGLARTTEGSACCGLTWEANQMMRASTSVSAAEEQREW